MNAPRPRMVQQVLAFNLHPERTLHASWLPADWPARYRRLGRYGEGAQAVLGDCLRRWPGGSVPQEFDFDTPLRRIALMDGPALRRLAAYAGFATHRTAFALRGVAPVLRRQAQRYDRDAAQFVQQRLPAPSAFAMNTSSLEARPVAAGHVVVERGYRLLLALLAPEGEALLQRVRHKLPRRVSALAPPELKPAQHEQLAELVLLCIVPERLPTWDWLF